MGCCNDNKTYLTDSLIQAGKSIIKHFTDPKYDAFVSSEIKEERLKICDSCEEQEMFLGKRRCKICLCFLEAKASLTDQTCPNPTGNRWLRNN